MTAHVTTDQIQQLFSRHRLRCTRQRRALYEALISTRSHPTADQLFQKVAQSEQDISLATVYNTLEAFCRAGLAQKLLGRGGSTRYDAATHNHLHLRDAQSDTVSDVPDSIGNRILKNIPQHVLTDLEKELGFRITQLQIELVGQFADTRDTANITADRAVETSSS